MSSRRPDSSPADHPVLGAGLQTICERAEPGPAAHRQPQEPDPEAAGAESSCSHEVGPGLTGEGVSADPGQETQLYMAGSDPNVI